MVLLAITFWQRLQNWDQSVFYKLNSDWTNRFFDHIMPAIRDPNYFWIPLYLFLAAFVLINFKEKGLWWIVFFICTVALTDMTGNYLFKQIIQRARPCNDPALLHVRLLVRECGSGFSFISNHAANHFGMATFVFLTFRRIAGKWIIIVFAWPLLVAYAQVYVGLHFPLDVICGALLGLGFGTLTSRWFLKRFQIAIFDDQPAA
jgi:undecaprenyl-diphosphatase